MNLRHIFFLVLLVTLAGCRKQQPAADPCDGLLNESPPLVITLQFVGESTGENLILTEDLQESDIRVTDAGTGKPMEEWTLRKQTSAASPLNGVLQLFIVNEKLGEHTYEISLKAQHTVTVAYKGLKVNTGNRCRPVAFAVGDIRVTDHPFTLFSRDGMEYPHILIVKI